MPYKDKERQREYQRKYQRERARKKRAKFFLDKSCVECRLTKNLTLHHVIPEDKISSTIWSWSEERRIKEIKKCIVLCMKCHRKKHPPPQPKHGTMTMYKNYGCKCILCRKRNAEYVYNRRRKLGMRGSTQQQASSP